MRITYDNKDPEHIFSDAYMESGIMDLLSRGEDFSIGQELAVNVVRISIIRGLISPKEVDFLYINPDGHEVIICLDKYGNLSYYPKGFCDTFNAQLDEMIDWGKPKGE